MNSEKSIYRLARSDMFTFDFKQNHVADLVNLPDAPPLMHRISKELFFPPLLIINLQLPTYAVGFSPTWNHLYARVPYDI